MLEVVWEEAQEEKAKAHKRRRCWDTLSGGGSEKMHRRSWGGHEPSVPVSEVRNIRNYKKVSLRSQIKIKITARGRQECFRCMPKQVNATLVLN
jgi:hypothetical protein